ncbi:Rv3654c family TadE-like protein [Catenulispora sp. MAP5-51]|uniref:Rv3654c family TadE-like protein n=1 Tax=unclassified Catenulispora TaxID=414885 RepID=UPI003516A9B1
MTQRIRDRGSATVYAALLAGLLTALTGAALALGSAVLARHRAGAAADLAALSAAVHAGAGETPCDWARRVAAAQRARLLRCSCDGPVCLVGAAVGTPWGAASVTSRAGPADDPVGQGAVTAVTTSVVTSAVTVTHGAGLEALSAGLPADSVTPRPPPHKARTRTRARTRARARAPFVPSAPAVGVRVVLAETEPLARAPAAPRGQLGAPRPRPVYPQA